LRQFDAFLNPSERRRDVAPYFVVLSSHHLQSIDEAVVAPLIRDWSKSLNGVDVVLDEEDVIRRALERLFSGF